MREGYFHAPHACFYTCVRVTTYKIISSTIMTLGIIITAVYIPYNINSTVQTVLRESCNGYNILN